MGGRPFQHVPLLHGLRQGQGLLPFPLGEEPEGLVGPGKLPLPEEEEPFREKPLKKPAPPALLQVQGRAVQGVGGLPLGQGAKPFLREAGGGEGESLGASPLPWSQSQASSGVLKSRSSEPPSRARMSLRPPSSSRPRSTQSAPVAARASRAPALV